MNARFSEMNARFQGLEARSGFPLHRNERQEMDSRFTEMNASMDFPTSGAKWTPASPRWIPNFSEMNASDSGLPLQRDERQHGLPFQVS